VAIPVALRVSVQAEKYREAEDIRRQRIREEEEAQKRTADYQMRLQEKLAERKMQERRRYGYGAIPMDGICLPCPVCLQRCVA
jgi:hypothetical protein